MPHSENFCSNCGTKLEKGAKFCSTCGQPVNDGHRRQPGGEHHTPRFDYPKARRHSKIITTSTSEGEPVVTFRNLHPNAVWLFFLQYLGRSLILLALFVGLAFFEPYFAASGMLAYLVVVFFIALINFKNYRFEVSTVAFRKEYGVFFKYSVNIAFDQIQNINMRRSIIDQVLGLAHLEIETAGTGGKVQTNIAGLKTRAEGYIPGITPEEALDVKQLMLARIRQTENGN